MTASHHGECLPLSPEPTRRWKMVAFLVTNICFILTWIYFFVLNRTRVVLPYRGGVQPNLMLVSNHQSPIDNFFIALAAFFPRLLVRPHLHPWNAAAAEYWFQNPLISWLADHTRCIPVRRGQRNEGALRKMCRVLPQGTMVFFPEGRRSLDGVVGPGRPGAGFVARRTEARIIPVAVDGLLQAMPYHAPRPRIGRRITIAFGDPIPCDDLFRRPADRETAQAIVDRAMAAVRLLHKQLQTES